MIRHLAAMLWVAALAARPGSAQTERWGRFEAKFEAAAAYGNALEDVTMTVAFEAPSGRTHIVLAFWDGGRTWRVRFSPDELGQWRYRTGAEPPDFGLHNKSGEFQAAETASVAPWAQHGPLRVSKDGRHFEHWDGTPFFWLADTAGRGPLLAGAREWSLYLEDRASRGFNVIQFGVTPGAETSGDGAGRAPYRLQQQNGRERVTLDPAYFQRLDGRVSAINARGLLAAALLRWEGLSEAQQIQLGRYAVARYGAHQIAWLLDGDADGAGAAARWKRVARGVFSNPQPDRLATVYARGRTWPAAGYAEEGWYQFAGYGSGELEADAQWKWLVEDGPPATAWRTGKPLPAVNLAVGADQARQAAYASVLNAPVAGVSYAGREMREAWDASLDAADFAELTHLRRLMETVEWWKLQPAPQLLAHQPGKADVRKWVSAAAPENGRWALVYVPAASAVTLRPEAAERLGRGRWFNPRTGLWRDATTLEPPDEQDWVLYLGR